MALLFQAPEAFCRRVNRRGRAAPNASAGEGLPNTSAFSRGQVLAGVAGSDSIRRREGGNHTSRAGMPAEERRGTGGSQRSGTARPKEEGRGRGGSHRSWAARPEQERQETGGSRMTRASRPEQERRRTGGSHMTGAAMPEEERRVTASSCKSGAARPEEEQPGRGSSHRSRAGRHEEERRGTGGGRRTMPHKPDQEQQPTGPTPSGRVSHVGASPGRRSGGAVRACGLCARTAERLENGKLQECSGCRSVRYCGKDCQKADWPAHKATCKRLQAARA
jgi:hypothetical protein